MNRGMLLIFFPSSYKNDGIPCGHNERNLVLTEMSQKGDTVCIKKILSYALVLMLSINLVHSQQEQSKQKEKEKAKEEEKAEKKEERTKYFQLDTIEIEVVEYIRDIEIPNMSVVKPELFPLSIGTTLDTALERQPGIDVQRIQEVGTAIDDDSIKIRGMGSRRIKVTKNGRLMNTSGVAGGYFIDWTMIPLANIDRVEVVKGVGDPRYGNVLGGIINLVPRSFPQNAPLTEIQASAASFGTASFNIHHTYKPGPFEYSLAADITRSDGYLKNGNLNFGNFDLHLGYDFPFAGKFTADITYARLKKGFIVGNRAVKDFDDPGYSAPIDSNFPASDGEYMYGGMGAYPEPESYWEKKKWMFDFGYQQAIQDFGFLDLRYWQNHGNRDSYNTRASLDRVFHKTFYDDRSQGFSVSYRHFLPSQTITAGLDFSHLKDDGDTNLSDDFRVPFRNGYYVAAKNIDFFLMDEIRLFDEKIILVPGIRYMSYDGLSGPAGEFEQIPDIDMKGWAPSAKFIYNYQGDSLVYFSLARALRMPTPPEHYWHYDFDDAGVDTSQLPFDQEDGLMIQGGWRAVFPSQTKLEIAPYYYHIDNYIQFDLINFVAYNIDKALIYGIEFEIAQQFSGGWSGFLNYTYQKSRTEGDPFVGLFVNPQDRDFDEIPGLPEHKINMGLQYKTRNNASIALFLQGVSSHGVIYNDNMLWNDNLRVRTQGSYIRLDLEGRYPLAKLFDLGVFIRNVLDEGYQERFGFPAAGRNVGFSLRAKF
jgi:outer membrane receptor protein involved in Fe transport